MTMIASNEPRQMSCVLRDLGDGTGKQYVPVSDVPRLNEGEQPVTGLFHCRTERHGPSGSHSRTVCTPARMTARPGVRSARPMACVLRDLGDGTGAQYVPVDEVVSLADGEVPTEGLFFSQVESHGPSGSHRRTVCMPAC